MGRQDSGGAYRTSGKETLTCLARVIASVVAKFAMMIATMGLNLMGVKPSGS